MVDLWVGEISGRYFLFWCFIPNSQKWIKRAEEIPVITKRLSMHSNSFRVFPAQQTSSNEVWMNRNRKEHLEAFPRKSTNEKNSGGNLTRFSFLSGYLSILTMFRIVIPQHWLWKWAEDEPVGMKRAWTHEKNAFMTYWRGGRFA